MEPVSTVISILALASAGAAAYYTRKQAIAAEEQLRELAKRRHEEEQPALVATVELYGNEPWLVITNVGLEVVEDIQAQLKATKAGVESNFKVRGLPETQTWSLASLEGFQSARTSISLGNVAAGHVALVVLSASRESQEWEWIAEVPSSAQLMS
ncbi:hypothetical protein [Actinoplanes regularis]|uniref:hypothetical protein n=1 Tax=Actinoplanes regularis TaxID=52697 RepID=UPI0024A2527E|nr:hypothetical protein [Actinoplanes regularis]GLW33178.1 hypothetical protein Areg01_61160 [Actinoplanes regularis]